ncbi:MAG: F0F1 ATP synthase subunit A, partial [Betaproteobacteria bacterium]
MKEGPLLLHLNIPNLNETAQVNISYTWFAMAVIIGLALAARFSLKKTAPTGFQNFFEVIVGGLENFIEEIMGPEGKHYFTLIAG